MFRFSKIIALFLVFSLSSFSVAANENNIRPKLKKIAKITIIYDTTLFTAIPNKSGSITNKFPCKSGSVVGRNSLKNIIDGNTNSCDEVVDITVTPEGEGIAMGEVNWSASWTDATGNMYLVTMNNGYFEIDPVNLGKLFSGQAIVDKDYYGLLSGRFQTNNPDLIHLNNTVAILEDIKEQNLLDGNFPLEYFLYIVDDDRNLFSGDDSDD